MRLSRRGAWVLAFLLAIGVQLPLAAAPSAARPAGAAGPLDKLNHVIVIYQENWSFDGLYGAFPGLTVARDARGAVKRSAARYLKAIGA